MADFEFDKSGHPTTGYTNIAVTLGNALTQTGKYKVFGYGFSYNRAETQTLFGINAIQLSDIISVFATLRNGIGVKDIILVSDIPLIESILDNVYRANGLAEALNLYGIYAVESDPLCMSWAISMSRLKKGFPISEFGTKEAAKTGLSVEHYPVPVDLNIWVRRTDEQKQLIRQALGLSDKYVMFVNADGNERKNISAVLEGLSLAIKQNPNLYLILLTRKKFAMTWKYDDLAIQLGIQNNLMVIERGIPQEDVWKLYAGSDSFWNLSKAEGCCLPILEAMAIGVPTVGTNATAMADHLQDGRGYLLEPDYRWIDPFGNGNRYFVFPEKISTKMLELATMQGDDTDMLERAFQYAKNRTLENAVFPIIKELENESK